MEKMDKKDKAIACLVGVMLILVIVVLCLAIGVAGSKKTIHADKVKDLVNSDNTSIILFTSKDCNFCKTAIKELDDQKINYYVYNTSKNNESDLDKALNYLSIDKKLFKTPAIIYIKDNIMFANMINLNSTSDLNSFIKQYKLTSVKFEK